MVNAPAIQSNHLAATPPESLSGAALSCSGVVKRFGDVEALAGLDLAVESGTILALLGPSGCGKTTALRIIAGFERPDEGQVSVGGRVVSSESFSLPPEKRRIGMVFQEGALFPHLSVEQNVGYGLRKSPHREQRVADALELVGLSQMRHRMPHELSGGQQQRVALGRALAPRPDILLLDEPFSNLDAKLREQLQSDVVEILHASGVTSVFVTHDQQAALSVGDEVAVMNQGKLEQVGSSGAVFHSPRTKFVAQFIGAVDFLPVEVMDGRITTDLGEMVLGEHSEDPQCAPGGSDGAPDFDELAHASTEMMVRPDCVECLEDGAGEGIVCNRIFHGAFYLYTVRMPSGRQLRSLMSHTAELPVGSPVSLRLRDGHRIRLFVNGELTSASFRIS